MKVKDLLTDPSRWTKGSFARDKNGNIAVVDDKDAVRWCLVGAIRKCYAISESSAILDKVSEKIKMVYGDDYIPRFNDEQGYEKVMELVEELDI